MPTRKWKVEAPTPKAMDMTTAPLKVMDTIMPMTPPLATATRMVTTTRTTKVMGITIEH